MLCPTVSQLRSKVWRHPDLQSEGTRIGTLLPLRRFGQGPSYGPHLFASQSATFQERSVQCCKGTKHKTYHPLDDHLVVLTTAKAFNIRIRRDELCCALNYPSSLQRSMWVNTFKRHVLETILHQYLTEYQSMALQNLFPDIWISVSICQKYWSDLKIVRMKMKNADTKSSQLNKLEM